MKKLFFILMTLIMSCNLLNANNNVNTKQTEDKITYNRLIASIAYVESKHNPNIVSKNGTYVGYLQISKVCVKEANNIVGFQKYHYNDRYDKEKSIEIFKIIQEYHNPTQDIHLAMRIWNEGISAKTKKKTITPYMRKVLKLYETKFSHIEE